MEIKAIWQVMAAASLFFGVSPMSLAQDRCAYMADTPRVQFNEAWSEIRNIPRFKDEFETTAEFEERQRVALSEIPSHIVIEASIDHEYVRYNADEQKVEIITYAISNHSISEDGRRAAFGWRSDLNRAGYELESYNLIYWALEREIETTGSYEGQNSFGVSRTILSQNVKYRAIIERPASDFYEYLWSPNRDQFTSGGAPIAFEISMPTEVARTEMAHLRAAVGYAPAYPYYADAETRYTPTTQATYDRNEMHHYLIGDIQCIAIYSQDGDLLATRTTQ